MCKRYKLYQKQKSGSNKDRCHFKRVKHLVQQKIKIAYENYLAGILGWVQMTGMKVLDFLLRNYLA